jgi:hypothetical protein
MVYSLSQVALASPHRSHTNSPGEGHTPEVRRHSERCGSEQPSQLVSCNIDLVPAPSEFLGDLEPADT